MNQRHLSTGAASLFAALQIFPAHAQDLDTPIPERVVIQGTQSSTLPTIIPTTIEGINAETVARTINAFDAEDALKYFPSLLVRKRFVGDFNHAVLATRASGTGNSARSLVFADGILLSNLLGNGASFTPRWGLVSPEEIARVDVLYGPFSAAYSGNSVGAVVDYVTRMPDKFQAQVKLSAVTEQFKEAATDHAYTGKQASLSLGDKQGPFSWWLHFNHLDSEGHPIAFVNKLNSSGVTSNAGTFVTGAVPGINPQGKDWWLLGASGQTHTQQDHAKIKFAYDINPTLRASYTYASWRNTAISDADSYLRDLTGRPVYSGDINIAGKKYTLAPTDITESLTQSEHRTHGFYIKSNRRGMFDWALSASSDDYTSDLIRMPNTALPTARSGGAGRIADGKGTGWQTLGIKGIWRPQSQHITEFGIQTERYHLRTQVFAIGDWITGAPAQSISAFRGDTQLNSLYAQDAWRISPTWRAILGARLEQWQANHGAIANATTTLAFANREQVKLSPKAALSYQWSDELALKASIGKAWRMPTVSELYQGSIASNNIINNDPLLKPEHSWTGELSAEWSLAQGKGLMRSTYFAEDSRDALYAQTNAQVSPVVTTIQNIGQIRTQGFEIAYQANDVVVTGLDLNASLTYAHSLIVRNDRFPASVGKWQPRVPRWRANFLASYRHNQQLSTTLGARYSGRQYGTLDNSDHNESSYTSVSRFFVADLRLRYQVDSHWSAALGIDNLNNRKYWAFHPYAQRSIVAELTWSH
ncbi:MAG: TonB-dependent receptor [Burkholderiales bacterium]|nr:TonB-dependent receptor [Burkholderiales bacterium]